MNYGETCRELLNFVDEIGGRFVYRALSAANSLTKTLRVRGVWQVTDLGMHNGSTQILARAAP